VCALYRPRGRARLPSGSPPGVNAASDPRLALEAWIDEIMSFGHQSKKAVRVSVLGAASAMRAEGTPTNRATRASCWLRRCSRSSRTGSATGRFRWPNPRSTRPSSRRSRGRRPGSIR